MELKDFRKIAAAHGYTVKTKRVGFGGFGYGDGRFIEVSFAGKAIGGVMSAAEWREHDCVVKYLKAGITDKGEKLIWS